MIQLNHTVFKRWKKVIKSACEEQREPSCTMFPHKSLQYLVTQVIKSHWSFLYDISGGASTMTTTPLTGMCGESLLTGPSSPVQSVTILWVWVWCCSVWKQGQDCHSDGVRQPRRPVWLYLWEAEDHWVRGQTLLQANRFSCAVLPSGKPPFRLL